MVNEAVALVSAQGIARWLEVSAGAGQEALLAEAAALDTDGYERQRKFIAKALRWRLPALDVECDRRRNDWARWSASWPPSRTGILGGELSARPSLPRPACRAFRFLWQFSPTRPTDGG
jgi:hypothetical protein